jgi:hypothetical protein
VDSTWRGGRLAAAVAAEDDVVGQQLLQPFEIALLGSCRAGMAPWAERDQASTRLEAMVG